MLPDMKLGRSTGGFTKRKLFHLIVATSLFSGLCVIVHGCIWMLSAKYESVKVAKLSWENHTDLRERMLYNDNGWGDPPRSQGYFNEPTFNYHCSQRQDGTLCVSTDYKTGMCMVRIPTYSTFCDYQYWDWPVVETKVVTGEGHTVMWLSFQPDGTSRRESKHGKYTILFKHSDGRVWNYDTINLKRFRDFRLDEIWELKIPNVGSLFPTRKLTLEKEQ